MRKVFFIGIFILLHSCTEGLDQTDLGNGFFLWDGNGTTVLHYSNEGVIDLGNIVKVAWDEEYIYVECERLIYKDEIWQRDERRNDYYIIEKHKYNRAVPIKPVDMHHFYYFKEHYSPKARKRTSPKYKTVSPP